MNKIIRNSKLFVFMTFAALLVGAVAMAQDSGAVVDSLSMAQDGLSDTSGATSGSEILGVIVAILLSVVSLGSVLFALGHMFYTRFFLSPRYKKQFTVEYFQEKRAAKELPIDSSADENQTAMGLLTHTTDTWTVQYNESTGREEYVPTKKKHLRATVEIINSVIEVAPTNQSVIDELNGIVEVVNVNETRHFSGSKPIIWIALIFGALFAIFGAGFAPLISMGVGAGLYIVASSRPTFLLAKETGGKIGFLNSILVGTLAFIGAARTVRRTTTYSDGSRSVDDDHSQHFIFLIIGLIMIVFLACTIVIWSFFNYLRNYVFYI